jgi:hypothetical protein
MCELLHRPTVRKLALKIEQRFCEHTDDEFSLLFPSKKND